MQPINKPSVIAIMGPTASGKTGLAIDIAEKINVDPKVFAIALIFAVNTSFVTPLAYQTNLLVMGPGHYKFIDYVKFGLPLTIICWIVFFITFPLFYEL